MTRNKSAVHVLVLVGLLLGLLVAVPVAQGAPNAPEAITFTGTELLTRPTSDSVSVTVVPNSAITNLVYQYGTTSGTYPNQTTATTAAAGTPKTVVIGDLTANTRYYYRIRYSTDSGSTWTNRNGILVLDGDGPRAAPSRSTITSDSHVNILMGSATTWTNICNDVVRGALTYILTLATPWRFAV